MNCTEAKAALPLLIYDEAIPREAALREHLAHCAACRREYEALHGVRRLLDEAPAPRVAVDLPRLYQTVADRQARRLRRWRRVAVALGAVAALLLLAFGLRLEVRLQAGQMVVSWGEPASPAPPVNPVIQPDLGVRDRQPATTDLREDLRVLSDLIHALKQDADKHDQRFEERLDRLQQRVLALQEQADLRWSATEQDVAALYLLTNKGEKP